MKKDKEHIKIPSKHLVVQHNDLIASKYDLSLSEMRLILEAVHNIEKSDVDFKEYRIDVNSFLELIETKNVSELSRVKEFCKTILSKPLEIPKEDGKLLYCNWFSNIEYSPDKKEITYSFDPKLKPYLIDLKEKFTRFDIRILLKFKSFYALRIYMLLKTQVWKGNKVEYIVEVEELRALLKLEKKYKLYGHFKSRVLDIATKYINEVSDIEISFEPIKQGRKIQSVKFKVERKPLKIENKNIFLEKLDFKEFKKYIVENYKDTSLCNCVPGYEKDVIIGLNAAGFLTNKTVGDDLTPGAAKKVWQWLFKNKDKVGNIIELSEKEKRMDALIDKKITTVQTDVLGNTNELQLEVKEVIEIEDDRFILSLINKYGEKAKTPKSFTLDELERILV